MFLTCDHSSQHTLISLSRYYKARGAAIVNYAKNRHFYYHAVFYKKYLTRQDSSLEYILYELLFSHIRAQR